ncbi:MAG: transposase [Acidobacteriia bacterium]|nr:transposase [Terriglobia bacterium]
MPGGLERFYGGHDLHFITCSCYRRRPLLGTAVRRDLFLQIMEQVRQRYRFSVAGYVVMPEHFHWLITEPDVGTPSTVMQVLKQCFAQRMKAPIWQERFYDFNVWSPKKRAEKLGYMHQNPVVRGLVANPEDWRWSSFRWYALREPGPVRVNCYEWPVEIAG